MDKLKKLKDLLSEKVIIILKFVLIALLTALFFVGENFKKRGGHPDWYWFVLAIVIAFGISLLAAGFLIRKRKNNKD